MFRRFIRQFHTTWCFSLQGLLPLTKIRMCVTASCKLGDGEGPLAAPRWFDDFSFRTADRRRRDRSADSGARVAVCAA